MLHKMDAVEKKGEGLKGAGPQDIKRRQDQATWRDWKEMGENEQDRSERQAGFICVL